VFRKKVSNASLWQSGLALIAGWLPVVVDSRVAGAIGVAGAMTGAQDRRIAEIAVAHVTA